MLFCLQLTTAAYLLACDHAPGRPADVRYGLWDCRQNSGLKAKSDEVRDARLCGDFCAAEAGADAL